MGLGSYAKLAERVIEHQGGKNKVRPVFRAEFCKALFLYKNGFPARGALQKQAALLPHDWKPGVSAPRKVKASRPGSWAYSFWIKTPG